MFFKSLKIKLILFFLIFSVNIFASVMTNDIQVRWGIKTNDIKRIIRNKLMKKYPSYNNATPEEQDAIIKKINESVKEIFKNKIYFKTKNAKYDNSIYAGEFHYGNNESMLTLINDKKTYRYFLIKDRLWKLVIVIEAEDLGKKYTLSDLINHFSKKYNLTPYKIDYDKFKIEQKIPIKAYFKDENTLLSISYNDIYGSFILVYSSIKVMKMLKKQGFNVIVKSDINLDVDVANEVTEYDQLLYESDYTSDEDDSDTEDVFSDIAKDFKKEAIESEKRKKEREKKFKTEKNKK